MKIQVSVLWQLLERDGIRGENRDPEGFAVITDGDDSRHKTWHFKSISQD